MPRLAVSRLQHVIPKARRMLQIIILTKCAVRRLANTDIIKVLYVLRNTKPEALAQKKRGELGCGYFLFIDIDPVRNCLHRVDR